MTAPDGASAASLVAGPVPSLRRRLAAFVYEGVLLFGVVMIAGLVFSVVTQQRHALQHHAGMQAFLFLVLGAYFVWFWCHGGQTVAMKAWHVRLVTRDGGPVGPLRAAARYVLSWLWFLPALVASSVGGLRSGGEVTGLLIAGVLTYAVLAFLHPRRQFWHDVVCGTQLVTWRPPPRPRPLKQPASDPPAQSGA